MCGIAGIVRKGGKITESHIQTMRDVFPYRGPDDSGFWIRPEGDIAFGHRRLSILDPTPAGHQPMHDTEAGLTIVFNGEVYNFIEIRRELELKDYKFRTGTDTEVMLAAYREWGTACLERFNGMFAFALWDEQRQSLFLARDRMGIKPLYYYQDGDSFYFASEVKAILAAVEKKPEINPALMDAYMSFGYIPGEDTLCRGIRRLLPAHCMVLDRQGMHISRYWDFSFDNREDRGEAFYIQELKGLLNDAIDLRLRSDVPLGIFLSGGLDSSAVVGLLAPRVSEPLKTFSVAYDFGADYNETDYARLVSRQFGTDHHEFVVSPDQFRDFIPDYVRYMDEPVTESAAISLYYIARMARDHVTVVLSGEGSDELFAGYDFYFYNTMIEKYRNLAGPATVARAARLISSLTKNPKLNKYAQMSLNPLEMRYKGISTYEEKVKESLYLPGFRELLEKDGNRELAAFLVELFEKTKKNDPLSRMLYFDSLTWLVDDLLIKADRMSMAPSLELRVPFLDYRIVEFAASIPSKYKLHHRTGKYILKKMMEPVLPKEIIHRKKMGFPTPLKLMFQRQLAGYAHDLLTSSSAALHGFFDRREIVRILEQHTAKKVDHHRLIWQLVVLENWLENYKKN